MNSLGCMHFCNRGEFWGFFSENFVRFCRNSGLFQKKERDLQQKRTKFQPIYKSAYSLIRAVKLCCILMCAGLSSCAVAAPQYVPKPFDNGKAAFSVKIDGLISDYSPFSAYAMPGEILPVRTFTPADLFGAKGEARRVNSLEWEWRAPTEPGVYPLTLISRKGDRMTVNVFVLVDPKELPRDYPMGRYPGLYKGHASYMPPKGFVKITEEIENVAVSPHFHIGQFTCKKPEEYPKYLAMRPELLLKLETLLEAVNEKGVRANGFTVMSGYRTPKYNKDIGRGQHSRHIYGDAADIFVDEDGDGVMDDVNRDGRLDRRDAAWLYDLSEEMSERPAWKKLRGGVGEYDANPYHGPFVHIDVRGFDARWGR